MGLSEKIAYDSIKDLKVAQIKDVSEIGFVLQVAYDNYNWEIVHELLKVMR